MRVERTYPGTVVVEHNRLRGTVARSPTNIYYYSSGETPPVSQCFCTFCGNPTRLRGHVPLPPCASCDNTEFTAEPEPGSQSPLL
ncbi:MAG: zinc ribbon-containing protein [Chloroflexota bacterium]